MKHTLLIAAGLLALAGCNNSTPPAAYAPPIETPVEAPVETAVNLPVASDYGLFPQGVSLPVAHHVRADRVTATEKGDLRRRVTLELLEGTPADALTVLERSMVSQGFTANPAKEGPEGRSSITFVKKGFGKAIVRTVPDPGPNKSHPAAVGVLSIDYPVAATQ